MPTTTHVHLLVAIAGTALFFMGARAMYIEAAPNIRGGSTAIARIANMPDGSAPIGLSLLSQHSALLDCEKVLRSSQSLAIKFLPANERARLPATCDQMAADILERSPADSFAWFIGAAAAAALFDYKKFNTDLANSQLTGPHEGWLASLRLELGEQNLDRLDDTAMALHRHDIRTVATTPAYRSSAAQRFVANDGFRQRMTLELDALTPAEQQSFLGAVRAAINAKGR